ncbi:MAG TPA: PIN domain-containing protein [Spirochaetota bacterium]|nr:PIN domain-containing protein [Spirochaetota bacterium]HPR49820.1 PIN domain-containing protein [Spirochaetota bacterium]
MVLVDTSVWIEHFRNGLPRLESLLSNVSVATHPYVIGELACGNMGNRKEILSLLQSLDSMPVITLEECLSFIEMKKLHGRGIGFVDVNLLASALLSGVMLWTRDRNLHALALEMGLAFQKR